MTALWTAAAAAQATAGRIASDWTATGISIDTRTLIPGDLFVALKASRDGHAFVAEALAKGAAAAMVSRVPDGVAPDRMLVVGDVLTALEHLGRAARARTKARVIGITGSVGKTSTKEMMRVAFRRLGHVHAAEASYNNHWGVPLTLARMPEATDLALIEIGMNHPGEIAPLARMAELDIAVITTVAAAHLEAFESLDGIAEEKASIFQGLGPQGIALWPDDIATSAILAARAPRGRSFGTGDYRLIDVALRDDVTIVRASLRGVDVVFKLGVAGAHFAKNALAVLAVGDVLGADPAITIQDLAAWRPYAGRGTREHRVFDLIDPDLSFDLIDDAFNANPTSLTAALDVLAAMNPVDGVGRVTKGRRIAVLGDMLELGPHEAAFHAEIADAPSLRAVDLVHCVGPRMRVLYDRLPPHQRGLWVDNADDLAGQVGSLVDAGDVVLIKGSKGSYVSKVVTALRGISHPAVQEDEG